MHPTILRSLKRHGRPYGVPTGAHRSNVLWFNRRLLAKAGVQPPSAGYTLDAFLADLEKVKASGAIALYLGGQDRFTTAELMENTLLSAVGERGWQDIIDDEFDWRSGRVETALKRAFLGDISEPATQLAFHRAKGSVPVVRDVDVGPLTAYQRAASRALWELPVLLSIAHGEAMSPRFQEGFYEAMATYVRTRDADAFADDLEEAVEEEKIPPR